MNVENDGWFIVVDQTQHGPYSTDQIRHFAAEGRVIASTPMWREGMKDWIPFGSLSSFRPGFVEQLGEGKIPIWIFIPAAIVLHFVTVIMFSSQVALSNRLSETLPATALGFFLGRLAARHAPHSLVALGGFVTLNFATLTFGIAAESILRSVAASMTWHLPALAFAFAVTLAVATLAKRLRDRTRQAGPARAERAP